jgi:hypothetical protein
MNGINAAANVLAYHLIDEELGVPLENWFDWVARYAEKSLFSVPSCCLSSGFGF